MTDELLVRLQSFAFDTPGAAMPFAVRLARENGWSAAFTARVLDEYRRFLWLAMRAGHAVTPSPAVDAAWHLHLVYFRSYRDDLCGRILQRPLHHDPTRGGSGEAAKYVDWYSRTLASYQAHFGPPAVDLWPAPTERFRGGLPRVVDRRTHWIVEKRLVHRFALGAVAGGTMLSLTGCSTWLQAWPNGVTLALVAIGVGLVVVFGVRAARRRRRRRGEGATPAAGGGAGMGCGACGAVGGGKSDSGCGHDSSGDSGDSGGGDGGGDSGGGDGGGCGGGGGD